MMRKDIDYKEATKDLYTDQLPTTHHLSLLLNELSVTCATCVEGNLRKITLQVVNGSILQQRTHAIVNITDKHLSHYDDSASLILEFAGVRVQRECE